MSDLLSSATTALSRHSKEDLAPFTLVETVTTFIKPNLPPEDHKTKLEKKKLEKKSPENCTERSQLSRTYREAILYTRKQSQKAWNLIEIFESKERENWPVLDLFLWNCNYLYLLKQRNQRGRDEIKSIKQSLEKRFGEQKCLVSEEKLQICRLQEQLGEWKVPLLNRRNWYE